MDFSNQIKSFNCSQFVSILLCILILSQISSSLPPVTSSLISSTSSSSADTCECHLRNLDQCSSHLILLSQPVPMMPPGDVFDRMCTFLNESYQCRQDYLSRCSTPSALVMIRLMTQKNDAAFQSLCSQPESAYWKSLYVANYYCLQSTKMLCRPCILDYQAGLEASLINETTQISGGCCAFNRLVGCTSEIIRNKCGADALAVSQKIAAIFASSVANNLCRTYPVESAFCKTILPPLGSIPKGDTFAYYGQIFGSNPGLSAPWGSSMGSSMGPSMGSSMSSATSKWADVGNWKKSFEHMKID